MLHIMKDEDFEDRFPDYEGLWETTKEGILIDFMCMYTGDMKSALVDIAQIWFPECYDDEHHATDTVWILPASLVQWIERDVLSQPYFDEVQVKKRTYIERAVKDVVGRSEHRTTVAIEVMKDLDKHFTKFDESDAYEARIVQDLIRYVNNEEFNDDKWYE